VGYDDSFPALYVIPWLAAGEYLLTGRMTLNSKKAGTK
jgi:hypothetical protein